MNEKEFNLAILAELKRISNEVFAKVKVSKEGTYTAAELWDGKNSFGEKIEIFYMGTAQDVYTAKVDTFEFKVSAEDVFLRLWKFEQLCKVRQADKERFTYGEAEHEIVNEKAMYYTGSMERGSYNHETECCEVTGNGNYKVVTRKKSLKKLSCNVAEDKKGMLYYKVVDVWYQINDRPLPEKITERIKNEPDYLFGLLEKYDFSYKWELTPIYKSLYDAMKSERASSTPEQRNPENEPEKAVIFDNVGTDAPENSESVQETNEDYPPEPYNKEKSENVATSYERFQDRTICGRFQKNMCPNYLRQKVFPTELFYERLKISRFNPRHFVGRTNHHIYEENSLERKRNGNTSVYRVLIRGETEIGSK